MSQLHYLRTSLKGSILQPGDEGYDLSKWADNATKPAQYLLKPLEVQDISKAIKFARCEKLPIAIRGGGHSTTTAAATEGLLIDMRTLNTLRVDEENKVLYAQAGALSHAIDVETMKYGLATTVGICSEVSIGGYATAAGIGFSIGQHGLAIDNVISATVVLANGDIVEASDNENPDLYWGIRGGGNNFGVVAELRMRLHPQRSEVYSFSYVYLPHQLESIVPAIQAWLETQTPKENIALLFASGPDGNPYCIINGVYDGSQQEAEASFKGLLDIGPVNTTHGMIPYEVFGTLADAFNKLQGNKLMVGPRAKNVDYAQMQKTYNEWSEIFKNAPASGVMYEFYHMEKMTSVPVEATAFADRHPGHITLCVVIWTDPGMSVAAGREVLLHLKATCLGTALAEDDTLGYLNYADVYSDKNETDEYARKMFGPNYARLQEVKKKYDPDMVWNTWFAIRPAV